MGASVFLFVFVCGLIGFISIFAISFRSCLYICMLSFRDLNRSRDTMIHRKENNNIFVNITASPVEKHIHATYYISLCNCIISFNFISIESREKKKTAVSCITSTYTYTLLMVYTDLRC